MGKRRRLGQNFLIDQGVAERIVALLADEPDRVFEIGPGQGALSEPLLARFGRVVALELDESLAPNLRQRFPDLQLHLGDALEEPFEALLGAEAPWQMASNLPYSVGSAIVRRLLPMHESFTRLVVMLQREVAERLVAEPGERNHGLLALERAAHARSVRMAMQVPPAAFRPKPKVHSSVVVMELQPAPYPQDELAAALGLAARALTRPRKMLANALRPLADMASIQGAGLDSRARPAVVSLDGWVKLSRCLRDS